MPIDVRSILYIIEIVCLLDVSANLVAILREVRYKGYITIFLKPVHKCTILSFKIKDLKYILKYEVQIKFL